MVKALKVYTIAISSNFAYRIKREKGYSDEPDSLFYRIKNLLQSYTLIVLT